jgi:hypothetical protein
MSQRIGMADGRCITSVDSSRILEDQMRINAGFGVYDNNKYRMYLQEKGPDALKLPLCNAACRNACEGVQFYSPLVEKQ